MRGKERETDIARTYGNCAGEEAAAAATAAAEGEVVAVRAWREGKTRFARERLVPRREFRLKISVVRGVPFRAPYGAKLAPRENCVRGEESSGGNERKKKKKAAGTEKARVPGEIE